MNPRVIAPAPVRRTLAVKASPERAFEVFTAGIGRWCPGSHTIGASPQKLVVIEPGAGGRWYEIGEDGAEAEWGRVLAWEPPSRLVLAWQIGADFRFDPALVTEVELQFIGDGAGTTRVEFEHRGLEHMGERAAATREALNGGWAGVLEHYERSVEARTAQGGATS